MEHDTQRRPRFVRWAVMIGIVIVLNLFFVVARALILPEPKFETYCPISVTSPAVMPQDQQSCTAAGGSWTALGMPVPAEAVKDNATAPTGYCNLTAKCQPLFDAADQQYRLNSFIMEIGFGVLAIIVGVIPLGSSIVSTGLSYGGVLAFIIAAAQYWSDAGNWLRFGISLIALVALIYIGIRRFHD